MKIYAEATTLNNLMMRASSMEPSELVMMGVDIALVNALVLYSTFGRNTYVQTGWEGSEMVFENDDGHCITINEHTLEVCGYGHQRLPIDSSEYSI